MDPILLAALQKLLAAQANAKQQGVDEFHPAAIDAFLRTETGGKFGYRDYAALQQVNGSNLLRSGMNAATFNLADNAIGLFSPKQADESRIRSKVFAAAHPLA